MHHFSDPRTAHICTVPHPVLVIFSWLHIAISEFDSSRNGHHVRREIHNM